MDKYEFNIKVEQIKKMVNKGDYETAMKIADTIDWRRVRNVNILSMVATIYEKNGEYQEAKDILLLAFERAPIGKRLLFKLAVELDMTMNILAAGMEIPEEQLRQLRGRCVQEVKKTHGMVSLDEAVRYQNGED